jgi:hypothetical protein
LVLALVLGGCSQSPEDPAATDHANVESERADCALAGSAAFKPACSIDRNDDSLILRHPDGGFRRFTLGDGDNRIRPADGAEAAQWRDLADGRVEVVVGQDRYRFSLESEPADASSRAVHAQ